MIFCIASWTALIHYTLFAQWKVVIQLWRSQKRRNAGLACLSPNPTSVLSAHRQFAVSDLTYPMQRSNPSLRNLWAVDKVDKAWVGMPQSWWVSHGGYHMVGITMWSRHLFFGTMAAMASLGFNVFTTSRHDPKLRRSPGDPRPTLDDKDTPIASPRFATFRHVSPMGQPMGQPMVQRISQKFGIFLMVTPREKMDSGWLQP